MQLQEGTVFKNRWKVGKKVGEGACASVHCVEDLVNKSSGSNSIKYVIKCIPLPTGGKTSKSFKTMTQLCNTLYYEYTLYRSHLADLSCRPATPATDFYGEDCGYRYLVIQRLDMDLAHFARDSKPTSKDVAAIGLQILEGMITIHQKGFLVVDMKPDNFMLDSARKVFFIDFGLMERIAICTSAAAGGHFQGTPSFASLAVHSGAAHTRGDDVEALGYVLLSLFRDLPWHASKSDAECIASKRACDVQALANQLDCTEVGEIITLSRAAKRDAVPEYSRVEALLRKMHNRSNRASASSKPSKPSKPSKAAPMVFDIPSDDGVTVEKTAVVTAVKNKKRVFPAVAVEPVAQLLGVEDMGDSPPLGIGPFSAHSPRKSSRLSSASSADLLIANTGHIHNSLSRVSLNSNRLSGKVDSTTSGPFSDPDEEDVPSKKISKAPAPTKDKTPSAESHSVSSTRFPPVFLTVSQPNGSVKYNLCELVGASGVIIVGRGDGAEVTITDDDCVSERCVYVHILLLSHR